MSASIRGLIQCRRYGLVAPAAMASCLLLEPNIEMIHAVTGEFDECAWCLYGYTMVMCIYVV